MLEEGRSYSGYERNSAFLNLGPASDGRPRYADISGASGLDMLDDGRSIGVTDWDFDGRLDFWITNRTAPRLRLQHNRSQTAHAFVALHLLGQSIGARVRLTVDGQPRVRSVRAGQGFLAQSSRWLHFGIRAGETISKAEVRWPGTSVYEPIRGLEEGRFFTLRKDEGSAQPWQPPQQGTLPETNGVEKTTERARIVMASPLPFPKAEYRGFDGETHAVSSDNQPLLINLWASWCGPCVTELREWNDHQAQLEAAGLRVLALSVEEMDAPMAERIDLAQAFMKKHEIGLGVGLATAEFLETLEVTGRGLLDKFESFPIPSSLLLDTQGRVSFVYKGPVRVGQLVQDVAQLGAPQPERHTAASHFPGTWIEGPWPATPTVIIDKFMSFGNPAAAKAYLDTFGTSPDLRAQQDLSESYYLVANELRIQKREEEAIRAYQRAQELAPQKTLVRLELGTMLFKHRRYAEAAPHLAEALRAEPDNLNTRKMLALAFVQSGRHGEAVPHLETLTRINPRDATAHLWLGHSLIRARQPQRAVDHFRRALQFNPRSELAANELAWILATHSKAAIRDPKESLKLAQRALQQAGSRKASILDTLAAAQAANFDFEAAVATAQEALTEAKRAGNARLATDLQRRLEIYRQGRPYREIGPSGP